MSCKFTYYILFDIFIFQPLCLFSFNEMFACLSEVLSIDILSNWSDLETMAKVNSAFCNKVERSNFLCILVDPVFSSNDSSYPTSNAFWKWIVSHGVKLQYLNCENLSDTHVTNVD